MVRPRRRASAGSVGPSGVLGISRHGFALDQIGHAERGGLGAPPAPGGKGDQQQRAVAKVNEAPGVTGGEKLVQHVARHGALALAPPRAPGGPRGQAQGLADVGRPEGSGQTAPAVQGRPVGQPAPHGRGRMGPLDAELIVGAKDAGDGLGHAVQGIGLALHRIPEMMGDKTQDQRLGGRPGEGT